VGLFLGERHKPQKVRAIVQHAITHESLRPSSHPYFFNTQLSQSIYVWLHAPGNCLILEEPTHALGPILITNYYFPQER
jgi:hypothetical protein